MQGIKLPTVFNTLYKKVFIISLLDAHHIRTNFITKANYHAVLKDSQNNISESWENNSFYKKNHRRALKDLSEVVEKKIITIKKI